MPITSLVPTISPTSGSGAVLTGDPASALTAQVNRFLKAQGYPEQPIQPGAVTIAVGLTALGILQARLTQSMIDEKDPQTRIEINTQMHNIAAAQSDPVAYVMPRIDEITRTLAIWGDIQGYKPAPIGITTRDPRIKRWYQTWWGMGLIGAGALTAMGVAGHIATRARE